MIAHKLPTRSQRPPLERHFYDSVVPVGGRKTDGGLCVTWPQFLATPLTVRQSDSFPGCLAIKWEACSSLVTSLCISQWIIPGSLLIDIQINLHPAMLHDFVNARPRSEPRGKKHCNQCRATTLKANIPPKRNAARRRSDVSGQLKTKVATSC
jgi:hypothetical protein